MCETLTRPAHTRGKHGGGGRSVEDVHVNGWARGAYLDALRGMLAAWGGWPAEWNDWLVTMIEKKGKDPRVFANLRDIWQSCHGWKIFTGMTRLHYQAVGDAAMPNFASGFRQRRNGMEAVLTTALAGEQAPNRVLRPPVKWSRHVELTA